VNPSSSDGALHSRTPTFFFCQHTSPPFPWFERCAIRSALHLAVTNGFFRRASDEGRGRQSKRRRRRRKKRQGHEAG
jgi:hypothetical protein